MTSLLHRVRDRLLSLLPEPTPTHPTINSVGQYESGVSAETLQAVMEWFFASLMNAGYYGQSHLYWLHPQAEPAQNREIQQCQRRGEPVLAIVAVTGCLHRPPVSTGGSCLNTPQCGSTSLKSRKMTETLPFHRMPECDRCWFNPSSPYLCCSVHPAGVQSDRCPDFQASAIAAEQHEQFISLDWVAEDGAAQWEPEGASYYGNELVSTTEQRWNREQKAALLDWHPMFTGRCPSCEVPLIQTKPPRVDWTVCVGGETIACNCQRVWASCR